MISLFGLQLAGGALMVAGRTFFPVYSSTLGMSPALISAVGGTRQLAGMVAALIGGALADRVGRKWTYFTGNVGFLFVGALFLLGSPAAVSALWVAGGFFLGVRALGGQSYLVAASDQSRMGTMSALFTWGTTLGGALGTLALGLVLDRSGYVPFAWTLCAGAVVVLAVNGGVMPGLRRAVPSPSGKRQRYASIARDPRTVVLALLRLLPTFYWGMAVVLVPLRLADLGASTLTITAFGTVSQIVASLAQIVTGRAADRRGPQGPAIVVPALLAAAVLGTAFGSGDLILVFVTSTLAAAAAWSMSALIPVLVSATMPARSHALTLGWVHLWWNIGMVAGAWVGGALYEVAPWLPFAVGGAVNLISPVLASRLELSKPTE